MKGAKQVKDTFDKIKITDFIPKSPGRISMSALAALLEISERDVRKLVLAERKRGTLIGADNDGYFIPTDTEELRTYYILAYSRAMTTLKSLTPVSNHLQNNGVDMKALRGQVRKTVKDGGTGGKKQTHVV